MSSLKELRELTGASINECSKALKEAQEVSDISDEQVIFGIAAGNLTWANPSKLLEFASSKETLPLILAGLSLSKNSDVLLAVYENPRTPEKSKKEMQVKGNDLEEVIRKRDEGLSQKKEKDRERTLSELTALVLQLSSEVKELRTSLINFSKAVAKRDQELVNAINRKGTYTVSSGFTVDFSQF